MIEHPFITIILAGLIVAGAAATAAMLAWAWFWFRRPRPPAIDERKKFRTYVWDGKDKHLIF